MLGDILECCHHFGKYWAVSSKTNICPWTAVICLQKYLLGTVPNSFIHNSLTLEVAHVSINRVTEKRTVAEDSSHKPTVRFTNEKEKKIQWYTATWMNPKAMMMSERIFPKKKGLFHMTPRIWRPRRDWTHLWRNKSKQWKEMRKWKYSLSFLA